MSSSKTSAELVFATLGAYQEGDEEKLRSLMHPEGEIHGAPGLINAGTYHGYEGFREWLLQWEEAWEEVNYEIGEIIEVSQDLVVVPVHTVGVGAVSGVEIDAVFGWLYEWRDGRAVRFHVYPDVDMALEAARRLAAERP
jgi:ketosteroid isomerase-like protein